MTSYWNQTLVGENTRISANATDRSTFMFAADSGAVPVTLTARLRLPAPVPSPGPGQGLGRALDHDKGDGDSDPGGGNCTDYSGVTSMTVTEYVVKNSSFNVIEEEAVISSSTIDAADGSYYITAEPRQ
ncbi:MAG: hypothetical protein GY869_09125, partial [Planctomycetes bacterium]|nr:hypothetical protein [Planctomycetota bacterium]